MWQGTGEGAVLGFVSGLEVRGEWPLCEVTAMLTSLAGCRLRFNQDTESPIRYPRYSQHLFTFSLLIAPGASSLHIRIKAKANNNATTVYNRPGKCTPANVPTMLSECFVKVVTLPRLGSNIVRMLCVSWGGKKQVRYQSITIL